MILEVPIMQNGLDPQFLRLEGPRAPLKSEMTELESFHIEYSTIENRDEEPRFRESTESADISTEHQMP